MLEVIIALSLAILLGNILAHKIRITPAIMLIFMGLVLALIPVHAMHEVREAGLPPHVILEIFLPVMLCWETRNTSWREVRATANSPNPPLPPFKRKLALTKAPL